MGVRIKNHTNYRLKVSYDGHCDTVEIAPKGSDKCKSGMFAIDETWKITTKILFEHKWIGGPSKTLKGIAAANDDREWKVTNTDLSDYIGNKVTKSELFKNNSDITQTFNVQNGQEKTTSSESLEKIMKSHGSKFLLSFGADGMIDGVTIKGKSEAEWTSEEKSEVEKIKKEIQQMESGSDGSIVVPPHFCLYKVSTYEANSSTPTIGYSVEPIK